MWLSGQYQRAIRVPRGVLRVYVPWRASEHPPCGCFAQRSRLASRHAWALTYPSPVCPDGYRSCTGRGPAGGHPRGPTPLSSKGAPRLRRRPPRHQAVEMWTRPSDRAPSYASCGQAMERTLPHRLPTLGALAPASSPLVQQRFIGKATPPAPVGGSRITPSSQEIRLRNNPGKSLGGLTTESGKQQAPYPQASALPLPRLPQELLGGTAPNPDNANDVGSREAGHAGLACGHLREKRLRDCGLTTPQGTAVGHRLLGHRILIMLAPCGQPPSRAMTTHPGCA